MIYKFITYLVLSFFYTYVIAQDTAALNKFEQRTIYQLGNGYYINEKKIRFKEFKSMFNKYPDASAEYKIYSRRSTLSALMFLGSLVTEIAGLAAYKNNRDLSNGLISAAVAIQLISVPISISGKNKFYKAMRLYNKNVMAF